MAQPVYSVSDLTHYLKVRLEQDPALQGITVSGEISNITAQASGHVYFTLKDTGAVLSCAMFKRYAMAYQGRLPKRGDRIEVSGSINLYPPHGKYQLIATKMRRAGQGDLHQRFLELKDKLSKEGLFSEEYKQDLPSFPKRIGVVTSPTGAVIRDIIDTIRRRFPHVEVILSPALVQGATAAPSIVNALEKLQITGVDLILLARGGGSIEDLWCFNDEKVARAIFDCEVPLISAIGHETDFTIADFVADVRAATPTAAAEFATPLTRDEILGSLQESEHSLKRSLQNFIDFRRQMLDDYTVQMQSSLQKGLEQGRREIEFLEERLNSGILHQVGFARQMLDDYQQQLQTGIQQRLQNSRHELDLLEVKLQALDLHSTLQRGFSLTLKDGKPIQDASQLAPGDPIHSYFAKGNARSIVEETEDHE